MRASIAITTYNHGSFIAECLDSVLDQEVDFDYEIVISDDASPDDTAEIIADYQRRHPEIVKADLRTENIGANANFVATLQRCRGDYISLLDGDDVWVNRRKLARQVELLDRRPECSMVFAPVTVLRDDGSTRIWAPPGRRETYTLDDLLRGNFIATSSVVLRNRESIVFPDWFDESQAMPGDWLFFCMTAREGSIGYLDDVMSVYRVHEGGLWTANVSQRVRRLRGSIETCRRFNADLGGIHDRSVRRAVRVMQAKIALQRVLPTTVEPLIAARNRVKQRSASVRS